MLSLACQRLKSFDPQMENFPPERCLVANWWKLLCLLACWERTASFFFWTLHPHASRINTDTRSLEESLSGARFAASATAVPSMPSLSVRLLLFGMLHTHFFSSYFYMFYFHNWKRKREKWTNHIFFVHVKKFNSLHCWGGAVLYNIFIQHEW